MPDKELILWEEAISIIPFAQNRAGRNDKQEDISNDEHRSWPDCEGFVAVQDRKA